MNSGGRPAAAAFYAPVLSGSVDDGGAVRAEKLVQSIREKRLDVLSGPRLHQSEGRLEIGMQVRTDVDRPLAAWCFRRCRSRRWGGRCRRCRCRWSDRSGGRGRWRVPVALGCPPSSKPSRPPSVHEFTRGIEQAIQLRLAPRQTVQNLDVLGRVHMFTCEIEKPLQLVCRLPFGVELLRRLS